MRHIKIFVVFTIVLLLMLSAGCTSSGFKYDVVETEGERLLDIHIPESTLIPYENEGLGTLYLPEFGYSDSFINAKAVFEKEIESVYSGTDSTRIEMRFSELTDGDHKWSGEIRLGNYGLYDRGFTSKTLTTLARVIVVGIPKDGGRSIKLQGQVTLKPVPFIEIDYSREKVETPQTVSVKAKSPVDMISIEYPDSQERFEYVVGDNLDTVTKDNDEMYHEYELNLSLPQPTTGCINLHLYDRYGMNYTKELYVPRDDELCIYGIHRYSNLTYDDESGEHIENDNYKVGFGTIKLDGTNFYEHFSIEIPPAESEFFDSLKDYLPEADRVNRTDASLMYGVSPNKEWVAINAFHTYNFYTSEEPFYLDGYKVDSIRGIDFLLINSQTKAIHKVGTRHIIEYSGGYLRETGPSYCVVKWTEDDKVYLIEQMKEDKIIRKSQLDNYANIVNQAQVPFASAKGVVLSLDDFTLTPSDEVVPVTPWVTFVDHTTGVTGYTEFIKFDDGKLAYGFFEPPGTFGESGFSWQSLYVSDSSSTYYLPDLLPPIDEYNLHSCDILSSGYINNKLKCVIYASHVTPCEEESEDYENEWMDSELYLDKIYLLDMNSGKLSELEIEDTESFCNPQKLFHCSDPELNKMYICISIKPIDQEWQQCLCTVDDDKIIRPEIQLQRMVEGYLRKAR